MRPLHVGSEIGRRIGHHENTTNSLQGSHWNARQPCFIASLHARQRDVRQAIGASQPASGFIVVWVRRPSPSMATVSRPISGTLRPRSSTGAAMTGQTACGILSSRARGTTYEEISFSLSIIERYRPFVLANRARYYSKWDRLSFL